MDELEKWFEKYGAAAHLKQQLEENLLAFKDRLTEEQRKALMSINLVAIRSCLLDCGLE